MSFGTILGIWIAAALTFMMFSFLYKDNPVYKLGEHIFLGTSIGYSWCIYYWNDIFPQALKPLFYPDADTPQNFWVLIPIVLGIFIILRMIPKLTWLSRISFALLIGGYAGLAVPNVISGTFLPQLTATMAPLVGAPQPGRVPIPPVVSIVLATVLVLGLIALLAYALERATLWRWLATAVVASAIAGLGYFQYIAGADVNQLLLLFGVFCTIVFFFFSLEHRGVVGQIGRVGVLFIMVAFGASFGYTVMARVSLLIGRFQFLLYDWIQKAILHHTGL